jgi:hypothetical protein
MKTAIEWDSRLKKQEHPVHEPSPQPFEERHYPISHWAVLWNFSAKTIREWFHDEQGPGILRQSNVGRRSKRDYTTIMISPSAAARVYGKRTGKKVFN